MSSLALSDSFEYLFYGSTAIINIFLFLCGGRLQTSDSEVDPPLKGLIFQQLQVIFIHKSSPAIRGV